MRYDELDKSQLTTEYQGVLSEFQFWKQKNLALDIARGKPSLQQLELSQTLLTNLNFDICIDDGIDARNYGSLLGLPCARKYWAEMLEIDASQCFVGGNSSLTMMYDLISKAYTHGLLHSQSPWSKLEHVKFLCPTPGYDRHFAISQSFGMELVPVAMRVDGPDMEEVERLIRDPAVKGMWCVPKYSNPDGITYSDQTVERIASMSPAASDFLLIWDNAYFIHGRTNSVRTIPNILHCCAERGNPDMVFEFASTSKITLPGAGMAVMATSNANLDYLSKIIAAQMISADKLNQLRHVRFLKNRETTLALMRQHAAILQPRFDVITQALEEHIRPLGIADWNDRGGGYFISLYTAPGLATRTIELCKEVGLTLTSAGAAYPYGKDLNDSHIRIAPSYPSMEEVKQAASILCICLRYAALEQFLRRLKTAQ